MAASWDGSTNRIYVDTVDQGVLSSEATGTGLPVEHAIGRTNFSSGDYFDGRIDDVRIYNRALCPDEVVEVGEKGRPRGVRILQWIELK